MRGTFVKNGDGEIKDDTTDNQCSTSTWKQVQDTESSVEEKYQIEINLRGGPQDAILKDEEQMKEVNQKVEKLKSSSSTKPTRDDLKRVN